MAAALLDASLLALLAVVTVSDLRTRLVPDEALAASLALAIPVLIATDPGGLPGRALAGLAAGGFLLGAALIRPGGMGLGDVKLSVVLGLYLGGRIVEALLIAFAAGSLAGLLLIARHGLGARTRTIPFAPFLAVGALAALAPQP
jgi:leader peptidase (prepilin peptidase) / N-methyltransferase